MKIISTSIFVDDQDKALSFYTDILGFEIKDDIPIGEFRWITLISSKEDNGVELVLEPNKHQAPKEYQQRLYSDGIPAMMFGVEDIENEYRELIKNGVKFKMEPTNMGDYKMAIFDDTCGNYIQIVER